MSKPVAPRRVSALRGGSRWPMRFRPAAAHPAAVLPSASSAAPPAASSAVPLAGVWLGCLLLGAATLRADFGPERRVTDGSGTATQAATGMDLANNAYISSVVSEKIRIKIIGPNLDVDAPISVSGLAQGDPDFATNSSGVTYMAFCQMVDVSEGREVYITRNLGGAFDEPRRLTTNLQDESAPQLALDLFGEPHLVWSRLVRGDKGEETQVVYRRDVYEAGEEVVVGKGDYPVLHVEGEDVVHVVYVRGNDLYYRSNQGGQFGPERAVTTTPFEPESAVSLGGDPDGTILVSYESKNSLYYVVKSPQGPFLPPRLLDRGSVLDPRMRVRSDGKVTIAYAKAGDIYFIQGQSSALNLPQRITETPEIESHPSLEVDLANNIHVSYIRDGEVYYRNNATQPTADFSALPKIGEVPLAVKFVDLSSGQVQLWKWDFGDGEQSTLRNPSHRYAASGKYTVSLEVSGPGATNNKKVREDYVFVQDPSNTLRIPSQVVYPNQTDVWFPVIAGHKEPIQAFQLMGLYDPNVLTLKGYQLAYTVTQAMAPEILDFNIAEGGGQFEVGCLFDFVAPFDGRKLTPGQNQTLMQLVFDVSSGAPQGATTEIRLENNSDISRIFNIFTVDGFTKIPALSPATVEILVVEPPLAKFFLRGDADDNGAVDITDAIRLLNFLFLGGSPPPCMDAADVNDIGRVDISAAISILNFLFLGGAHPAVPFPTIGIDPTADPLPPCP